MGENGRYKERVCGKARGLEDCKPNMDDTSGPCAVWDLRSKTWKVPRSCQADGGARPWIKRGVPYPLRERDAMLHWKVLCRKIRGSV